MQPISEIHLHSTKLGDSPFRCKVPGLHKCSFEHPKCGTLGSMENKNGVNYYGCKMILSNFVYLLHAKSKFWRAARVHFRVGQNKFSLLGNRSVRWQIYLRYPPRPRRASDCFGEHRVLWFAPQWQSPFLRYPSEHAKDRSRVYPFLIGLCVLDTKQCHIFNCFKSVLLIIWSEINRPNRSF